MKENFTASEPQNSQTKGVLASSGKRNKIFSICDSELCQTDCKKEKNYRTERKMR